LSGFNSNATDSSCILFRTTTRLAASSCLSRFYSYASLGTWKGTKLEFDEKDDFGFKTPSLEGIAIALHQLTFRQLKMNKTQ
jgi:hypothetical protein